MEYFPIALRLKGRRVIVVGGGFVAERKVKTLLEVDAQVTVVAPYLAQTLGRLYEEERIEWQARSVRQSDISQAALVIAATNKSDINEQVSCWAHQAGIPVNVVDCPSLSNFISCALIRQEEALVAVYTDAKNPVLSRDLKNYLKDNWHDFLLYRNRST